MSKPIVPDRSTPFICDCGLKYSAIITMPIATCSAKLFGIPVPSVTNIIPPWMISKEDPSQFTLAICTSCAGVIALEPYQDLLLRNSGFIRNYFKQEEQQQGKQGDKPPRSATSLGFLPPKLSTPIRKRKLTSKYGLKPRRSFIYNAKLNVH